MMLNRRQVNLGLASLPMLAHRAARAEPEYPNRPVRLVVPYDAGGGVDAAARPLARALSEGWGQPVIVDNKPGADSIIGTGEVARAKPDGYTILLGILSIVQNPHLRAKMPFDTLADLAPVVQVSTEPLYLVVTKTLGVTTPAEFIDLARRKPGKLSFGSWGNASTGHLLLNSLQRKAQVDITHVPFKGMGVAVQTMIAGDLDSAMVPYAIARIGLETGKIVVIGAAGPTRSPVLPQVPTLEESGLQGFSRAQWMGLFAPAKTPKSIVDKIAKDVTAALSNPALVSWLAQGGASPAGGTPEAFAHIVRQDSEYYRELIKAANLRLE
ncbi:tripartite-type tricarboxylate transporter receptor subunit TctC [Variovorax beijingensis]|uniref:Tripartite-type tricarboxylate transporter receptor subunit TctC n=1 Tax=Variovorax beijingensis TaxID=2496117 RepID=A0A561BAG4_9BURK|nr:tripartite tricarboxylate transporter substrate-binding protein [Variovorax beijingensis]TWD75849.1 tripartite-type tricarboxylate transporter receptor subunit TctC [Variovorax beijingensis]